LTIDKVSNNIEKSTEATSNLLIIYLDLTPSANSDISSLSLDSLSSTVVTAIKKEIGIV
jgi:hypothetical protein